MKRRMVCIETASDQLPTDPTRDETGRNPLTSAGTGRGPGAPVHPVKQADTIGTGTGSHVAGVTIMVAVTLVLAFLAGAAVGITGYALIAAWILRPDRPRRAAK
jgi:hypothetical protein